MQVVNNSVKGSQKLKDMSQLSTASAEAALKPYLACVLCTVIVAGSHEKSKEESYRDAAQTKKK